MPSFGGVNIFGYAVKMKTGDLAQERQENSFPGLNGVESLTMGSRGLYTVVTGVLFGFGGAGLGTVQSIFRSYRNGNAYVLFTTLFQTWNNVVLESFEPEGDPFQDGAGNWHERYQAKFRHLSSG
jgi:hypothetical protein